MSWFERTHLLLRPDEIRVVRHSAVVHGRTSAHALAVASTPGNGAGAEPWRASTDALARALSQSRARGPATAVISDHFVRYALIPWNAALVADGERLAFARLHFHEVYGALADTWDISIDQQPAGQASFACALDRALLLALREACTRQGARLVAVVPALADRINRHRSSLKGAEFCVASVEPRRMTLAFHGADGWRSVRSRRSDGALEDELPTALKQEAAAGNGAAGGVLYLIAERLAQVPPFNVAGWKVVRVNEAVAPQGDRPAQERPSEASRLPRRLTPQPDPLLEGLSTRTDIVSEGLAPHSTPVPQGESEKGVVQGLAADLGPSEERGSGSRAPSAL